MPTYQFNRYDFQTLWITLQSNEELGVLDTGYIESYDGTDGQLSLYNPTTLERFDILMSEVPSITPGVPHDVLTGYINLSSLVDGNYQVQCRVRDLLGNYSIFGAFQFPSGAEQIVSLNLEIVSESRFVCQIAFDAPITGGYAVVLNNVDTEFDLPSPAVLFDAPILSAVGFLLTAPRTTFELEEPC